MIKRIYNTASTVIFLLAYTASVVPLIAQSLLVPSPSSKSLISQGPSLYNPAALAAGETHFSLLHLNMAHQKYAEEPSMEDLLMFAGSDWFGAGINYHFETERPTGYFQLAFNNESIYTGLQTTHRYYNHEWFSSLDLGLQWEFLRHFKIGASTEHLLSNDQNKNAGAGVELAVRPWLSAHSYAPFTFSIRYNTTKISDWSEATPTVFGEWAIASNLKLQGDFDTQNEQWSAGFILFGHPQTGLGFNTHKNSSQISLIYQEKPIAKPMRQLGSYLWLDLNMPITEDVPSTPIWKTSSQIQFEEKIAEIRSIHLNTSCKTVFVTLGRLQTSWAIATEIRSALNQLAKQGVKIVVYLEGIDPINYYVASISKHIAMPPQSHFYLQGFATEVALYKGTLDKLGLEAQFVKHGKYKSFPESFTRDSLSSEFKENLQNLISGLWTNIIDSIALSRNLSKEQIDTWFSHPSLTIENAIKQGWIDTLLYKEEIVPWIVGTDAFASLPLPSHTEKTVWSGRPKIAIVRLEGDIVMGGQNSSGLLSRKAIASDPTINLLQHLRRDPSIKGVLLRVSSGGGSALASDLIRQELLLIQKEGKKVAVSIGGACASGAYYISSLADTIIAEPVSIVGSIGVFGGKVVTRDLWNKIGTRKEIFKTHPYADGESAYRKWTPEEVEAMQEYMDAFYVHFTGLVSADRHMDSAKIAASAEGQVFVGSKALEKGLIDALGGMDDTRNALAHLLHTNIQSLEWNEYSPQEYSAWENLANAFTPNWASSRLASILMQFEETENSFQRFDVWAWNPEAMLLGLSTK